MSTDARTISADALTVFGVRHHGPGSARSLVNALAELQPDCILVEGPPDAVDVLALAAHADMQPPVALLVYSPDEPARSAFYPFAVFSPEWQAIRYGLERGVPVRFMDLPVANCLALDKKAEEEFAAALKAKAESPPAADAPAPEAEAHETPANEPPDAGLSPASAQRDPLDFLAEAAGFSDGERWWEHLVEHRQDGRGLFKAILEAMTALRVELAAISGTDTIIRERIMVSVPEILREAHMRQTVRAAGKEGFGRIAVVCGAWHAPALAGCLTARKRPASERDAPGQVFPIPTAKEDAALLKGLPKMKVAATWAPWTYAHLSRDSGYGAGVRSPGWYHHLWEREQLRTERWLTRVAHLLRKEDLDASPAQTIDAVRLAEALAAVRGRPLPGLDELNESVQAVFCFGSDLPLRLIHDRLIVGEVLGATPPETPAVPLQQDIAHEQKRLRLKPSASQEDLELDLRAETGLDRSRLLHRLDLLGVPWGQTTQARGKGTFKEIWKVQWQPEFAVRIIEASRWGVTVPAAASALTCAQAEAAPNLAALTALVDKALLADLPDASAHVVSRLQAQAALASDVGLLMDALPSLANVLRYGNVRQTDQEAVSHVVSGLVARVCVGLSAACASLNDEAAAVMHGRILAMNGVVTLLQNPEYAAAWQGALKRLAETPNLHGLVGGRCVRLLLDAAVLRHEEAGRRLSFALSTAADPAQAAAWIEGFLSGSGALLVHDQRLWGLLDEWVCGLGADPFVQALPLLRRTFSTFSPPERRIMGERVKSGEKAVTASAAPDSSDFDAARAEATLPLVRSLLGLPPAPPPMKDAQ